MPDHLCVYAERGTIPVNLGDAPMRHLGRYGYCWQRANAHPRDHALFDRLDAVEFKQCRWPHIGFAQGALEETAIATAALGEQHVHATQIVWAN